MEKRLVVFHLGELDYNEALKVQLELVDKLQGDPSLEDAFLMLLRHPPTLTIGRSGSISNVLATSEELREKGVSLIETDRGGDVTYHGPGQIVGYPIIRLARHGRDVHSYLRRLEAIIIRALADFGISAYRNPKHTGVWVKDEKIAAMGIHIAKWISYHGFALNVNTDMSHFALIHPCGIRDKGVTTMQIILNRAVDESDVEQKLADYFAGEFGFEEIEEARKWESETRISDFGLRISDL